MQAMALITLASLQQQRPGVHFRTYGDALYENSKRRIVRQARDTGWFATAAALGPSDLPAAFVTHFRDVLALPRGGGYWIWKFAVIKMAMEHVDDGDVLVYADAGCFINAKGRKRFYEYLSTLNFGGNNIVSFQQTHPEQQYTTERIFKLFAANASVRESNQYVGGIFILMKGPHQRRWFNFVMQGLKRDKMAITDMYNAETKRINAGFVDNRHDQSIMSVTRKIVGSAVFPDDTWPPGNLNNPIWASRIQG